jgi:hypothetical protein
VGIIYTVLPIIGLISKPLFGAIGDRFKIQKKLFLLFQLVIIVSFFSILFIPPIPAKSEFHCHSGVTLMKFCPPNLKSIDNCTINSVMNGSNSDSFGSDLKCDKNDAFKSVCGNWNVPGLCESSDDQIKIHTKVHYDKIEFIEAESCFYLTFYNGTVNGHESSMNCPSTEHKLTLDCGVRFDDETANEVFAGATDSQVKTTYQFWTFFLMLIISWAGMAVCKNSYL